MAKSSIPASRSLIESPTPANPAPMMASGTWEESPAISEKGISGPAQLR
jgi:hypothetical protein